MELDNSNEDYTNNGDDYQMETDNNEDMKPHGKSKPGSRNQPSRVVHIALIPQLVRDEDIAFIALAFGEVKLLLYIRKKRHALICFEQQEDAEKMVNYFASYPGEMFGTTLSIEYSNHSDLNFPSMSRSVSNTQSILQNARELKIIAEQGVPGSVLRVAARNVGTTITTESLYRAFSEHGVILKIVISKRTNPSELLEAFIQMKDADSAKRAAKAIDTMKIGNLYSKFDISTARDQALTVKYNNARCRDFTNPTLLASSDSDIHENICLSAGIQITENSQGLLQQLSRLVGFDLDRSLPHMSRDENKRKGYSHSPQHDMMQDDMHSMNSSKRRRPEYMMDRNDSYEPFDDSWQGGSRMFDEFSGNHGRQSPSFHGSGNREELVDQLLMLGSRNPNSSNSMLAQSLASGRMDNGAIAVARQILAERAMSVLANDPYSKLLNSLISSGGRDGLSGGPDSLRNMLSPHSMRRMPQDDSYGMMPGMGLFNNFENRGGSVLLVSNLNPEKINPDALFTLFGVYGDVQRVKLMFTRSGSALIQLSNPEQAMLAITHLDGIMIYGKRMRISPSKYSQVQVSKDSSDSDNWSKNYENTTLHRYRHPGSRNCMNIFPPSEFLHLSNICDNTTKEELSTLFEPYGRLINIRFFETDRRMGIAEMDSVQAACEALIGAHNHMLTGGRRLRISFAKQKR